MFDLSANKHKTYLSEIIGSDIKPFLIDNGFRKNGQMFYSNNGEIIKLIEPEYFRFNSFAKFFFRINISVYAGDYGKIKKYTHKSIFEHGMPFVLNKSIGRMRGDDNYMYEVIPGKNRSELSEKMKNDLSQYVLPLFDQLNSCSDILRMFPDDNFMIALMYAKMKNHEESRHYFLRAIEIDAGKNETAGFPKERYIGNVRESAEFYGITL